LNSCIKYIADIVYQEIGEGEKKNQMSYSNFQWWISQNQGILKTFDKWLRRDIWGIWEGLSSSSSIPKTPTPLHGYADVNMKIKKKRVKLYKKLFMELKSNILLIYTNSERKNLLNVYILKDLKILVDESNHKIKIFHLHSAQYLNLTMQFRKNSEFKKWTKELKPFMLESVEKHYLFREKIGRGTFSTVNLVEKRDDHSQKYAIKIIEKENLKSEEKLLILEEAKIIKDLNHENIIKFYEHYEDYKKTFYVFELVEGGDLLEYVLSKGNLSESESKTVFKQLLRVVRYLHNKNILHRDLKPENIMIELDQSTKEIKKIKLIDFGFATYFCKENLPSLACGTINYAAPEVLVGEEYDESSDLFSCGVILYFM
jgi:tRNA A-37 threonylcarbamoyl transferase component Bud32